MPAAKRSGGGQLLQYVFRNFEVGENVLHVVVVFERGDELS